MGITLSPILAIPYLFLGWGGQHLCAQIYLGGLVPQDSFLLCDCSVPVGQCGGVVGAEFQALLLFFCMVFLALGKPVALAERSASLSLNTIVTSDLTGFWLEACIRKY